MAELGGGVRRVGLERGQPGVERRQWAPPLERGPGRAQQLDDVVGPVVAVVEGGQRGGGRLSVRGGVGEAVLFLGECLVLVGVVQRGGVDLGELVAQQIGLAGPGPVVASERFELGVQGAALRPDRGERAEVDPGEGVQSPSLRGAVEQ